MEKFKMQLANVLAAHIDKTPSEVREMMETPPNPAWGDIAIPCFPLARLLRKAPQAIAAELAAVLAQQEVVAKAEVAGGYVNVTLHGETVARDIVGALVCGDMGYGDSRPGSGKTVVIDFSSPNIAKPFGIGHLRTTVIGHSLSRLYSELGYRVERVNHLGDWGTQFGKLIVAYKLFGNDDPLTDDPISTLYRIYVEFHAVADDKPELEEEARLWFKKLEQGDPEARRYWQWFIDVSLREYQRVYDLLGIDFDHFLGESFYEPMLESAVAEVEARGLTKVSDGALIVDLEPYGMPPCLLRKSDGATLYATRDIAAALYRDRTYQPELLIYVVGQEQILHFRQLKQVLQLMGEPAGDKLVHVPFGLFKLRDGRMSTRRGKMIFLEDVLAKSIDLASEVIAEKNPDLAGSEEIARQVGVGAVVFGDLKNGRIKDVVFDWEEILNFDGETGPYVQYTHARVCSLLRRAGADAGIELASADTLTEEHGLPLIKLLGEFPQVVERAARTFEPSLLSRYLLDVAQSFNRYYHHHRILVEDASVMSTRLAVVTAVQLVLSKGLYLLGIAAPDRM